MKTRALFGLLLLPALHFAALAVDVPAEVLDMVRRAPGTREYPADDGLLLRQVIEITLDREGKVTRHEESYLKMLTDQVNRAGWFDPRLDWNDARAELTVDQAYSIMADGKIVQAQANSLVPNTDHALEEAVPFAFMRQMTVAQVGVEHGGTTVLAYTVKDRRPSGVPLWGSIDLGAAVPILDQRLRISVPEGTPFHWAGLFADLKPVITSQEGMTTYAFDRRDVPAFIPQEISSGKLGVPRLVFSTARGWPAVRQRVEQDVQAGLAKGGVSRQAEEIISGSLTDEEKIALLHTFVVEGIKTVSWPLSAFDYMVRSPEEVLNSSVGHPLEKAVLLAALLKAAALKNMSGPPLVLLAAAEPRIAGSVPAPVQFPDAWVAVGTGARVLMLDPTAPLSRRNRSHLIGIPLLLLDGASTAPQNWSALEGDLPHRAALRLTLKLEAGPAEMEVSGQADLDLSGGYNPLPGFDRSKDQIGGLARSLAGEVGNARIKEVFPGLLSPAGIAFRALMEGGSLSIPDSGLVRVPLPRPPGGLSGEHFQMWRGRRTLPLLLPAPAQEIVEMVLQLPSGFEPVGLPGTIRLQNKAGTLTRTVQHEAGKVTVRTELHLLKGLIEPEEYPDLRGLFAALDEDTAAAVWLRRAK